ncbi:hypothetical protein RFI_23082, partial [Reticulomyxa filosa]
MALITRRTDGTSEQKILTFEKDLRVNLSRFFLLCFCWLKKFDSCFVLFCFFFPLRGLVSQHAYNPLYERLEKGVSLLDNLATMLHLRIESDTEMVRGLQKALKKAAQYIKQKLTEHINALTDDVYKPLVELREHYAQNNKRRSNNNTTTTKKKKKKEMVKQNTKLLEASFAKRKKVGLKYEKGKTLYLLVLKQYITTQDVIANRNQLANAKKEGTLTSSQIVKITNKTNTKLETKVKTATENQQQWKERYEKEQDSLAREKVHFYDEMTAVLQGMEANELTRLQTVGDCLRKWAVFTTNVCANRSYDIQSLAEIMSLIRP